MSGPRRGSLKINTAILNVPEINLRVSIHIATDGVTRVIEIDTPGWEPNEKPFRIWLNDSSIHETK